MDNATVYRAMANSLNNPDERSVGVYKMLMDVYPAFSKKLFEGNQLMQLLVMSGNNPMDILEYPVCGRCETLALWNGVVKRGDEYVKRCTCVANGCGASTLNPITLREWIKIELQKKAPPDYIEAIEYCVDRIAAQMVEKHRIELQELINAKNGKPKRSGIILPDGTEHVVIQHNCKPEDYEFTKED